MAAGSLADMSAVMWCDFLFIAIHVWIRIDILSMRILFKRACRFQQIHHIRLTRRIQTDVKADIMI